MEAGFGWQMPAAQGNEETMNRLSIFSAALAIASGSLAVLGLAAPPAAAVAAAQRGGSQVPERKTLLAWADTRNGRSQHAFTSHALAIVEQLGWETGLWDTFIRTDSHIIANEPLMTTGARASGGPSLSDVDGIFFLGHREVPIEGQQRSELLDFIRSGHGFVAAHTALTAFSESWPEFAEMIGARYGGHPISGPGTVLNEQPTFPAVRHFPLRMPFDDEFYLPDGLDRDQVDVLLRLDTSTVPADEDLAPGTDYPLAWAKTYGQGRVFYSSLSHAREAWDLRVVQTMYFEAIKWALGMTDAMPMPHAMREVPVADARRR